MNLVQELVNSNGTVEQSDLRKKVKLNCPLETISKLENDDIVISFDTINLFQSFIDKDKKLKTSIRIPKKELEKYFPHTKQLQLFSK